MTKNEFIQEAALRIIARDSESSMISIADYAAELADEVWKRFDVEEQPAEPEIMTGFPDNESVQAVADEIARLEKEYIDGKNAECKGKSWRIHYQKSGANIRFLNCCHSRGESPISTVKELIECGSHDFKRRPNMGRKTMDLLNQALENLYNIRRW